jgi:hypothetical protein
VATSTGAVLTVPASALAASLVFRAGTHASSGRLPDPDTRPLPEVVEGFGTARGDPGLRLLVIAVGVLSFVLGVMDVLVVVAALGFLGIGEAGRLPDGDLGDRRDRRWRRA